VTIGENTMTRTMHSLLAAAAAVLVVAGCGSGSDPGPANPDPRGSTLSATPGAVVADGVAVATLTATARDASGQPLAGRTAVFQVSGTANQLSAVQATTGASGIATVTVASTKAEAKVAQVAIDGVPVAATAALTFVAGPVSVASSSLAASPGSLTAGVGVATVVATVRDAQGKPIPALAVDFVAPGGTLGAAQASTDADGVA
jgi:Bacterial Ig-like domain (group 1)